MHIYIPTYIYIYIYLYDSMILDVCVKTDISIKFCKYFPMKDTAKPLKASVVLHHDSTSLSMVLPFKNASFS